LKATIHETMLRVIHIERNRMRPRLITAMPLEGMMQFIQQGEFANNKIR